MVPTMTYSEAPQFVRKKVIKKMHWPLPVTDSYAWNTLEISLLTFLTDGTKFSQSECVLPPSSTFSSVTLFFPFVTASKLPYLDEPILTSISHIQTRWVLSMNHRVK